MCSASSKHNFAITAKRDNILSMAATSEMAMRH